LETHRVYEFCTRGNETHTHHTHPRKLKNGMDFEGGKGKGGGDDGACGSVVVVS
jgi:hypothetical protein